MRTFLKAIKEIKQKRLGSNISHKMYIAKVGTMIYGLGPFHFLLSPWAVDFQ